MPEENPVSPPNFDAALKRALMYENLLDGLDFIVQWEHDRAKNAFLTTGSQETCFRFVMGRLMQEHAKQTLLRPIDPWPTKRQPPQIARV